MDRQEATPSNVSNKRKRGRPRKEQSGVQGKNMPAVAGSANVLNSNQSARTTDNNAEVLPQMVGRMILGVIEGTFNGGYLIKVQVADTHLRGTVFLPGRVVPVTAENDVAPHVRMIERQDMPVPVLNPDTQVHNSVPSSRQRKKRPFKPELQVPTSLPITQVHPTELYSDISDSFENQFASVAASMVNPETQVPGSVASSGQHNKQPFEPGLLMPVRAVPISQFHPTELYSDIDISDSLENQFASVVAPMADLPMIDSSVSIGGQPKESTADGGAAKDSEKTSEVINSVVPTAENTEKELETGHQSVPSVHEVDELVPDSEKEVWRLFTLE